MTPSRKLQVIWNLGGMCVVVLRSVVSVQVRCAVVRGLRACEGGGQGGRNYLLPGGEGMGGGCVGWLVSHADMPRATQSSYYASPHLGFGGMLSDSKSIWLSLAGATGVTGCEGGAVIVSARCTSGGIGGNPPSRLLWPNGAVSAAHASKTASRIVRA